MRIRTPSLAGTAAPSASGLHTIVLTIDRTKVPGSVSNFPVYVDLSLLPAGFWSRVSAGGGNIRAWMNDGITELPREVVSCDTGGQTGELHIKYTGQISSAVDTVIKLTMPVGASDYAATDPYGRNAVWSDYLMVHHFQEVSGTLVDSTGRGNNAVAVNSPTYGATGKMGKAATFSDTGDHHFVITHSANNQLSTTAYQVDFWASLGATQPNWVGFFAKGDGANNDWSLQRSDGTGDLRPYHQGSAPNLAGAFTPFVNAGYVKFTGVWKYSGVAIQKYFHYRNGAYVTEADFVTVPTHTSGRDIRIGSERSATLVLNGSMDEFRIQNVARSTDWITAEYNNQNSPATFFSDITEIPGAGYTTFNDTLTSSASAVGTVTAQNVVPVSATFSAAGLSTAEVFTGFVVSVDASASAVGTVTVLATFNPSLLGTAGVVGTFTGDVVGPGGTTYNENADFTAGSLGTASVVLSAVASATGSASAVGTGQAQLVAQPALPSTANALGTFQAVGTFAASAQASLAALGTFSALTTFATNSAFSANALGTVTVQAQFAPAHSSQAGAFGTISAQALFAPQAIFSAGAVVVFNDGSTSTYNETMEGSAAASGTFGAAATFVGSILGTAGSQGTVSPGLVLTFALPMVLTATGTASALATLRPQVALAAQANVQLNAVGTFGVTATSTASAVGNVTGGSIYEKSLAFTASAQSTILVNLTANDVLLGTAEAEGEADAVTQFYATVTEELLANVAMFEVHYALNIVLPTRRSAAVGFTLREADVSAEIRTVYPNTSGRTTRTE